ncbi:MAG TPA: class I adenylate-forming enzyme family protein, partial [Planctomycetota bacterium]|nr:class I adenylate-forming enzyme family protein [Planctomycetota bacterium]
MPRKAAKKPPSSAKGRSKPVKRTGRSKTGDTRKVVEAGSQARPQEPKPASQPARLVMQPPLRRTSEIIRTRARFTDPMRAANEYSNVRDLIQGQAAKHGARTFLVFEDDGREYSFLQLDEQTTRAANVMLALGATRGARVALLVNNSPEYVFAWLGAMKAGLVAVPLSTDLSTDELRQALQDCGASLLLISREFWPRAEALRGELAGLQAVAFVGDGPQGVMLESTLPSAGLADPAKLYDFTACGRQASLELKTPVPHQWDEAQIAYTGRALPLPQGAILQQRQFLTSARCLSTAVGLNATDRLMCCLPLFHVNAQVPTLFAPLALGGSVVLFSEFSVSRFWPAVERYRVTAVSAVPAMLGILTERELEGARLARRDAAAG